MIIGVSGKSGAGKDLFASIFLEFVIGRQKGITKKWEVRKFAGKLKEVICLLTGCTVKDLENPDFKNSQLPAQWNCVSLYGKPLNGVYLDIEHYIKDLSDMGVAIEEGEEEEITQIFEPVNYTYRKTLTYIGTDLLRESFHPNVWVNALMNDYKSTEEGYPNWIITDVRFLNEAHAVREKGGILVRINREEQLPEEYRNHSSETDLDNYQFWSFVIDNNGTVGDFILQIEKFVHFYEEVCKKRENC